ncbi:MAG: FAD-dependent oxidoreductase [Candidatus Omnitrophica bacterium]|nr:FAD-dependent oxidoreductase [Candidatus Omnitrophota bacterium]
MHYLIIGGCAAGLRAAQSIRERDPVNSVTLISAEPYLPYARCLIPDFLAGTRSEQDLYLEKPEYYQQQKIELVLNDPVIRISYEKKEVQTASGKKWPFDRLLVGTGSTPKGLNAPGEEKEGVYHFWTFDDARKIIARSASSERAVIFGGGLIGLKAAYALKKRGLEVQLAVKSHHLLSQLLNEEAADILAAYLKENGIVIRTGCGPKEILGDNQVRAVNFDTGESLEAQIVIVGKGVAANKSLAEKAGLNCSSGIVVDDYLQTGKPNVFAAGDVAETKDIITGNYTINGLWLSAQEQGWVAGENMAGFKRKYPGSLAANAAEFFGLPFVAVGLVRPEKDTEVIDTCLPEHLFYRRFLLRNDILIGFVFVGGDISLAGFYTALVRNKVSLKNYKPVLGQDTFDYADLRDSLEENAEGFRESLSIAGKRFFFK